MLLTSLKAVLEYTNTHADTRISGANRRRSLQKSAITTLIICVTYNPVSAAIEKSAETSTYRNSCIWNGQAIRILCYYCHDACPTGRHDLRVCSRIRSDRMGLGGSSRTGRMEGNTRSQSGRSAQSLSSEPVLLREEHRDEGNISGS